MLLYGSDIWGIYNYKEVDKLHIICCKMVLGVRKQTMNYDVLGELGRLPLSSIAKFRSIKYWLQIQDKNNPNTQLQQFYNQHCEDNAHINNKNLAFHVKHIIYSIRCMVFIKIKCFYFPSLSTTNY